MIHLKEIEEKARAASQGPWSAVTGSIGEYTEVVIAGKEGERLFTRIPESNFEQTNCDASFIASARTDVPLLLEEIRKLAYTLSAIKTKMLWAREGVTVDPIKHSRASSEVLDMIDQVVDSSVKDKKNASRFTKIAQR